MEAVASLRAPRVEYFAVYPDGRRVSVTPEAIEKYGNTWTAEPDERFRVKIETYVTQQNLPIFGKAVYV